MMTVAKIKEAEIREEGVAEKRKAGGRGAAPKTRRHLVFWGVIWRFHLYFCKRSPSGRDTKMGGQRVRGKGRIKTRGEKRHREKVNREKEKGTKGFKIEIGVQPAH